MTKPAATKHVCIHGHFYQPPRENPWLDVLEREDSAAPYHDWNERINSECYRANAASRLVDDTNHILQLRNNYKCMSFNFGPTLLRWIERHDPWVEQAIRDADRESRACHHGHGNAIAQAYNHLIMPLANRRDKMTQVLWGIRDFEWRFGRKPEGMWLPETAVDRETLEVLAEAGIRFTILSPFQAHRWRALGQAAQWLDVRGGGIPTGRAYLCNCGKGRSIHTFFYDATLAKGIAFDRLLEHSSRLLNHIDWSYEQRSAPTDEPWLVHVATDGESYGHHFKFGDMAVAAAFQELERNPTVKITNYGEFLSAFPVRTEVEVVENTAWSCAHGLGRWTDDCGCHIGGGPGWNQKWRAPLREALNNLRDALASHYEHAMGRLCKDPWKARDEYIDVLLNPKHSTMEFVHRHMKHVTSAESRCRFLQLLEMQRFAMSMFTSCGWFFDDIAGLESILILRYAARATQLAEQTGAPPLEASLLNTLKLARSNLPEYDSGADVYLKKVKPEVMTKDRVVASYAIQALARSALPRYRLHTFSIAPQREDNLGPTPIPCLCGSIKVKDDRTLEEEDYLYAVLHFGALDFRCSVKPFSNSEDYQLVLHSLQKAVEEQNTVKMVRILDGVFGVSFFGLHDVFRDLRSSIALEISRDRLKIYTDFQRHMYETNRPLMKSLRQWGIRLPSDLRAAVRRVLSDQASQVVAEIIDHERHNVRKEHPWRETDFFYRARVAHLHSLLEEARSWGVSLRLTETSQSLGEVLVDTMTALGRTLASQYAGRLLRLLTICRELGIKPEMWKLQTLYFEMVQNAMSNSRQISDKESFRTLVNDLDQFLGCRFGWVSR